MYSIPDFHNFSNFLMFKVEKILGFGRFIFMILGNKSINPVLVTYPNSKRAFSSGVMSREPTLRIPTSLSAYFEIFFAYE